MAAHDGDAVGETVGGGDHLTREEEEHHGLEIEAQTVDDLGQDLAKDDAICYVKVVGVEGEGFDDLLLRDSANHLADIEDDGGGNTNNNECDLGPLVDAEDDEEDRQQREGDDFVEEEDETQETSTKPGEQTDVESEENRRNEQQQTDEEATSAGDGVLPDHGVVQTLPTGGVVGRDVVVLFGWLQDGGMDTCGELMRIGDDAIFTVLAMTADGRLHIQADTNDEQQHR